ncbi:MAG: haloacid dehalogenase-like hydrolase [Clostridia bacterium]|nr:haloacid dehalogenase-like hydrolase [Clostridia bacterium]
MNVYDFDKTIYNGDSTRDFYYFCLRRHPVIIKYLPYQGFMYFRFSLLKNISKTRFKEKFYSFFKCIKNIDDEVNLFWDTHSDNVKKWYLENKNESDLVISASPEFLLTPICKKLGINLIASRVDKLSGKTEGENCYGEEKVNRLKTEHPGFHIEEFYSDSRSDKPLANLAEKAFIVKGNKISKW